MMVMVWSIYRPQMWPYTEPNLLVMERATTDTGWRCYLAGLESRGEISDGTRNHKTFSLNSRPSSHAATITIVSTSVHLARRISHARTPLLQNHPVLLLSLSLLHTEDVFCLTTSTTFNNDRHETSFQVVSIPFLTQYSSIC
jgi:hypothetical protein